MARSKARERRQQEQQGGGARRRHTHIYLTLPAHTPSTSSHHADMPDCLKDRDQQGSEDGGDGGEGDSPEMDLVAIDNAAEESEGELESDWDEFSDDDGAMYYHNRTTEETSYEKPCKPKAAKTNSAAGAAGAAASTAGDAEDWDTHEDDEGNMYFHNRRSSVTTYDRPESLALPPGWQEVVGDDGSVYFFNEATNESTHDRPQVEAGAGGVLPPGWSQAEDDEGRVYFHNKDTEESTYDRPAAASVPQSLMKKESCALESKRWFEDLQESHPEGLESDSVGLLPPGWQCLESEDGSTYYHCAATSETLLKRPGILLPFKWRCETNAKDGKKTFIHTGTGESSDEVPEPT